MYAIYTTNQNTISGKYVYKNETAFFGCRAGIIPKLLRKQLSPDQSEPFGWHLPILQILGKEGETFIINLKPKNKDKKGSLSLYELLDVWGYSECGWTPAMLRLRGLVVDGDPKIDNPMSFHIDYSEGNSIIYSFLYFGESTIQKGALIGKWTAPRSSPTNSVLLWPSSLVYFINQIQITTPKVFTRGAG